MVQTRIELPMEAIQAFCQRWRITELAVFGSALSDDFRPDSDVDFLMTYAPDAGWSLLDHAEMQEELGAILGRKVDLLTRRAVEGSENPYRRKAILESAQVIYATAA